jgi:S-methylmethionine-dependent homocysteine/selenocysteine methylase
MPAESILARLARGDRLLLDGATGSELQHRGVNVTKGASADGVTLGAWSATAISDAPEVVQAIHEDYCRVGADIITANSYNTNRGILGKVGLQEKMEEYSRRAIELARAARDKYNPNAYVAGSIAPIYRMPHGWDAAAMPPEAELRREWGDQAAVLAKAGADLILIESMYAIAQLLPAVDAARATGLPVFLSIQATARGTMESGETAEQLVAALRGHEVDAILLMCSSPDEISATLPRLRQAWKGPIGAYANLGYVPVQTPLNEAGQQYHDLTVRHSPSVYAAQVKQWLAAGAQIVGGCCASSPEHIAMLRPLVK